MGNIKKQRKKYSTPAHPWQKSRIDLEKELIKAYGLTNKKEIWKFVSKLKKDKQKAKKLIADKSDQAQIEKAQLLKRLTLLGLLDEKSTLEDVLSLDLKTLLERRLQTLVYRKKLSRSLKQARQFITHRHIIIGSKKITSPSYLVKKHEEPDLSFAVQSGLADPEHPERAIAVPEQPKKANKEQPKKADKNVKR